MWLDDLLAGHPTTAEVGAIANAEMQRDTAQINPSDDPASDLAEHGNTAAAMLEVRTPVRSESRAKQADTMPAAGGSVRSTSVRGAVRTESAISGRPHLIAFTVMLPGRDPFRVTCPQGFEAVSAQWPTAIAITPL